MICENRFQLFFPSFPLSFHSYHTICENHFPLPAKTVCNTIFRVICHGAGDFRRQRPAYFAGSKQMQNTCTNFSGKENGKSAYFKKRYITVYDYKKTGTASAFRFSKIHNPQNGYLYFLSFSSNSSSSKSRSSNSSSPNSSPRSSSPNSSS